MFSKFQVSSLMVSTPYGSSLTMGRKMFSPFCRRAVSLLPVPVASRELQQMMGSIASCSFGRGGIQQWTQTTVVTLAGVTQCSYFDAFANMILVD